MFTATVNLNADQPTIGVEMNDARNLFLSLEPPGALQRITASIELEQLQTLILTLQAAEVRMRSWQTTSPRWP